MEKRKRVELISKHWHCSDKNVYKLMKKEDFKPKLNVIELGCICVENKISADELNLIIKFIHDSRGIGGN